ncbi:MAG: TIGR02265 family protein, partial [Thermoanaerobaculia bacterium]
SSLDDFARRAGHAAATDAVKGIYRFFALVLTPAALLSKASQMWTSLYNRGELQVTSQTDRSAKLELTNITMEVAGCARMTGWIERMAELTGAKAIRITHAVCSAKGASRCEWQLDWS